MTDPNALLRELCERVDHAYPDQDELLAFVEKVRAYLAHPPMSADKEPLVGAIARAWCHPGNTHKVLDQHLVMAIKEEVEKWLDLSGKEKA